MRAGGMHPGRFRRRPPARRSGPARRTEPDRRRLGPSGRRPARNRRRGLGPGPAPQAVHAPVPEIHDRPLAGTVGRG
ncbi:hypothetical protein C1I99_21865 [Micromonospora deserti]|uniref:Uncharacterized protein n=1 Tax=Micromonospora deserti TaxID=2070366 RepID=A0A2W2BYR9_9ACTN|nr:hypothetical protein C1I99_21865 [Micromonospora deserti]